MTKSPDAFRTISEVATWLGVQAHVLRFWESKFTQVKPVKRAGGRRYYRPSDMRLIGGIKTLLHDDGMTIKGVQKILREQGSAHVATLSPPLDGDEIEAGALIDIDILQGEDVQGGTILAFKAKPAASPRAAPPPEPASVPRIGAADDDGASRQPSLPLSDLPDAAAPPRESATPAPAAAGLPSFLSPAGERSPMATPPQTPRPQPVAVPDPLAETELTYTPGLLGHLAGVSRLSADRAARIAPLTRALRDWYERQTKAGNG